MTCAEFIEHLLRPRVHDPDKAGYSDEELLSVVEASLLHLYATAGASGKGTFVKDHTVTHYGQVPADFGGFCGQYPIRQQRGRFYLLTEESSLDVRYNPAPPQGLGLDSELPLPGRFLPLLLDVAAVRALNRNEFDTTQDQAVANALLEGVAGMLE
jgi:hypothetical protein